ncbi:MAG TPA: hypothetical protein VMZ28_09225 [Kofleriaceae bacterium]|nr:hypothetical protein [Kofleriaceae bacterium]
MALAVAASACGRGGAEGRGLALPEVDGVPVRIDEVRAEASVSWIDGMNDVAFPEGQKGAKGAKPKNSIWLTYRVTARDAIPDDQALEARSVCRWGEQVVASPFLESLKAKGKRVGVGALADGASAEGTAGAGGFPPFETVPEICEIELRYGARLPQGSTAPAQMTAAGTICWLRGELSVGPCKDALRPGTGGGGGGPIAHFEGAATDKGAIFWFLVRGGSPSADVVSTRTTCRSGATSTQKTESSQERMRLVDLRATEVALVVDAARPARDQTAANAACEVGIFMHLRDDSPAIPVASYCIEGSKATAGSCTR